MHDDLTRARFEAKVDRSPGQGPGGDCHEWVAQCDADGYGRFRISSGTRGTHRANRVAWWLATQEWPTPWVLHRCDNPPCVNPDHLFLGTPRDNVLDMEQKGRRANVRGERNPQAKLTNAKAAEIRALRGRELQRVTAERYGVSVPTISDVQAGKMWRV